MLRCVKILAASAALALAGHGSHAVRNGTDVHHRVVQPHVESLAIPEQIHLAFAGTTPGSAMTVSWATRHAVDHPQVWFGLSGKGVPSLGDMQVASASTQVYYAEDGYALFNHHATLPGLVPHTRYDYIVGSQDPDAATSTRHAFTTARGADTDSFAAAVYGDMGVLKSEHSIAHLNQLDDVDLFWHIGDISYADDAFEHPGADKNAFTYEKVYNQFMEALAPAMASRAYMVTVGNHEAECYSPACLNSTYKKDHLGNFSAFNARFRMPSAESNGSLNMWYTWTHGPVQFISVNSETDFPGAVRDEQTGTHHNGGFGDQVKWLGEALAAADLRRDEFPWVFVGIHRPLYSVFMENSTYGRLPHVRKVTRALQAAFEPLFLDHHVDVVVMGHVHSYERHVPIAHGRAVWDGVNAARTVYDNPKAPTYILTGAGGNVEDLTPYLGDDAGDPPEWNVVWNNSVYGVSTVRGNGTHLTWAFIDTATGATVDEFTMIKTRPHVA